MRAQLLALADAANLSVEGKLNILGEFNVLWAADVPVVHPFMMFVALLELSEADGTQFNVELRVLSEDGGLVFRGGVDAQVPQQREAGIMRRVPLLVPIAHSEFPAFGSYTFELRTNGAVLGDLTMHLRPMHPSPAPGAS